MTNPSPVPNKIPDLSAANLPKPTGIFDAQRAAPFFRSAESRSGEYAIKLLCDGLRLDPSRVDATERLLQLCSENSGAQKNILNQVTADNSATKSPANNYIRCLVQHALNPGSSKDGLAAAEAAAELGAVQVTYALATRCITPVSQARSKSEIVRLVNIFEKLALYELASTLCESAAKLDPSDGQLGARVKNLAALAYTARDAMKKTDEGSFRGNIRDAEQQTLLHQQPTAPAKLTPLEEQKLRAQRRLAAAQELFEQGMSEDAVKEVQKILAERQEPPGCFTLLGRGFMKLGLYPEAVVVFRRELERDKNASPDLRRDRQYDLIDALVAVAEKRKDKAKASEAELLLTDILIQDITFKNAHELRKRVESVLTSPSSS